MSRKIATRFLIGLVFFWNIQAAIVFLAFPREYLSSFMLSGKVGEKVIQSWGILFIMWNIPYFMAMLNPEKERGLVLACLLMQLVGVVGETFLYVDLSEQFFTVKQSILRFIVFDGAGLLFLFIAWWLSRDQSTATA
ncbi:hypothetical protein [Anaerolinea sp.]|uniref:hypothetical protein n=1 Tax=Anaerolinea sp. TaxID=1872519 RepID=UPI002ACEF629|nr:hypothetical protein [Anaerolinea sp.]